MALEDWKILVLFAAVRKAGENWQGESRGIEGGGGRSEEEAGKSGTWNPRQ